MSRELQIFDQIRDLVESVDSGLLTTEIARLDAEIAGLDARITARRDERIEWCSLAELRRRFDVAGPELTMGHAIVRVLEDHPPGVAIKLKRIGEELVARGWMGDIRKDWHRLRATASSMARSGLIERPRTGYYKLPIADYKTQNTA